MIKNEFEKDEIGRKNVKMNWSKYEWRKEKIITKKLKKKLNDKFKDGIDRKENEEEKTFS